MCFFESFLPTCHIVSVSRHDTSFFFLYFNFFLFQHSGHRLIITKSKIAQHTHTTYTDVLARLKSSLTFTCEPTKMWLSLLNCNYHWCNNISYMSVLTPPFSMCSYTTHTTYTHRFFLYLYNIFFYSTQEKLKSILYFGLRAIFFYLQYFFFQYIYFILHTSIYFEVTALSVLSKVRTIRNSTRIYS